VTSDEDAVSAANAAFYGAFEARDLDAMADVWDRTDRATITHPGWPTLYGWAKVAGSWDAIFRHTPYIQFFLMNERVHVMGDVGWVTLEENILQATGAGGAVVQEELDAARVAAVNVFVRTEGRWRMVLHHGAPIAASDEDADDEA
jgi:ketosteroid isomerase-like protein